MSLPFARNIANRKSVKQSLRPLLTTVSGPVTFHVFDGQFRPHTLFDTELDDCLDRVADCSIIYALEGSRSGLLWPIASFVANEPLGLARLQYLIDDSQPEQSAEIPQRTLDTLAVYIRNLFSEISWVQRVTVPSIIKSFDGQFQLHVESNDVSTVTLADQKQRPQSARNWP